MVRFYSEVRRGSKKKKTPTNSSEPTCCLKCINLSCQNCREETSSYRERPGLLRLQAQQAQKLDNCLLGFVSLCCVVCFFPGVPLPTSQSSFRWARWRQCKWEVLSQLLVVPQFLHIMGWPCSPASLPRQLPCFPPACTGPRLGSLEHWCLRSSSEVMVVVAAKPVCDGCPKEHREQPAPGLYSAWQHLFLCRKCCFSPGVAMAMGKQALFGSLGNCIWREWPVHRYINQLCSTHMHCYCIIHERKHYSLYMCV